MARKVAHAEHENHERWLISYADFITLLFAFFVVMFASSQTDKHKAQAVSDSVKQALEQGATKPQVREILGGTVDNTGKGSAMMHGPGGSQKQIAKADMVPPSKVTVTDLVPSMKYLTQALAQEIKDGKVDVHLESRGLVVSLRQATFFPSGGDEIAPETHGSMARIAEVIKGLSTGVRLEGHTDSIPIHNGRFRSNWELSAARAIAMLELFATQYDIPRERFGIAGYADTVPVDTNDTPQGRAHNRRVDIAILNQQVVLSAEPLPAACRREETIALEGTTVPERHSDCSNYRFNMPCVQTKFFGPLDYTPGSVFRFPEGLPGFEEQREFVFLNLPDREPLVFMQSLSTRNLCFVLLPVPAIDPDFGFEFTPEELSSLHLPAGQAPAIGKDVLCAALLCCGAGETPTANLMAPVIVNLKERIGYQLIHGDSGYSHRHPLLSAEPALAC